MAEYGAQPVEIGPEHRVLLIRLNHAQWLAPGDLYEKTRASWKVAPERHKPAWAFAVYGGIVRAPRTPWTRQSASPTFDLPLVMAITDRLLDPLAREVAFAEAHLSVVGPFEAFDGHRPSTLRRAWDGRRWRGKLNDHGRPVTTPTASLASRGKLRSPPTPRRGSEVQAAASSHRPAPDAPKPRDVQPPDVVVGPQLARSPWPPDRSHRRHSGRPLPAKPTSDQVRRVVLLFPREGSRNTDRLWQPRG